MVTHTVSALIISSLIAVLPWGRLLLMQVSSNLPTVSQVTRTCRNNLEAGILSCNFGGSQLRYLRRSHYDAATVAENIRNVVDHDASLSKWSQVSKNVLAREIVDKATDLFVQCIFCNLDLRFLQQVLARGFTDSRPPTSGPNDKHWNDLRNSRWILRIPPIFNEGEFFRTFHANSVMPIEYLLEMELGGGTAGKVYKAKIDAQYYNIPSLGHDPTNPAFSKPCAIKVFSNSEHAERECQFSQLIFATNQLRSDLHITRFYTGFSFGGKRYLISELADTSLQSFVATKVPGIGGLDATWLRVQIIGLTTALEKIHGPTNGSTACLHDIKPENILVFYADNHRLKFTDWGCADINKNHKTEKGSYKTERRGDSAYLPPEHVRQNPTSRPFDVWSLGCVFVELLVWFYEGWDDGEEGIYTFKERVKDDDNIQRLCWFIEGPENHDPEIPATVCEQVGEKKKGNPYVLAPSVDAKLAQLEDRGPNMANVVEVVRKMFVIDPSERITAREAAEGLALIPIPW